MLFQFVQRELEALKKMRHEIVQTRQVHILQRLSGLFGRRGKFIVSGLELLNALDIRRELVGGLDDDGSLWLRFGEKRPVTLCKLLRQ